MVSACVVSQKFCGPVEEIRNLGPRRALPRFHSPRTDTENIQGGPESREKRESSDSLHPLRRSESISLKESKNLAVLIIL